MTEWKYLYSGVFKIRYVIAAHYLRDCETIVEIGGYRTPIDEFLTHDFSSVTVIDPLIVPMTSKRVSHLACDYREVDYSFLRGKPYGVAILGMEIPLSETLFELVRRARTVVIEFTEDPTWTHPRELYDELRKNTNLVQVATIALDLSGNHFGDLTDSWPPRTSRVIYVLRP